MASPSKKSAAKAKILGKRKPGDDLKTQPILKKHKETTEGFADSRVELSETKSDQANLISEKEVATRTKRLFVGNLSRETKISDIINFFHDVGGVVRITLIVTSTGEHTGDGFVEFASSSEAKKALEKKNGGYLYDHKISVKVAKEATYPPKYCIDHKVVWYEDYLGRKSLLIEENETVEGQDEDTSSVKEVAIRRKTLFIADLSPQTELIDVCKFFHRTGQVVSLQLIVNHEGKCLGCGFVEFFSADEAKKALEMRKGGYLHDHKIFLDVARKSPYPPRPKSNLAEKLRYEDYLRRESLLIEEDETVERVDEDPDFVEEVAAEEKTLFVSNLSPETRIIDVCKFFHFAGEVVHVRLNVDHEGNNTGHAFVEFASAKEAKKALEEKNGEIFEDCEIIIDVAKRATYPPQPKFNLAEILWYEDYLRRESPHIEDEDETMEGLVQEVAIRKKTIFLTNLPADCGILDICNYFCNNGFYGIVGQRLIVNHKGQHVGCGFVELASAYQAERALRKLANKNFQNRRKMFMDVAKIAPYPPRPKYNLAEKVWYEDSLILRAKPFARFCGKKTTFVDEEEASF